MAVTDSSVSASTGRRRLSVLVSVVLVAVVSTPAGRSVRGIRWHRRGWRETTGASSGRLRSRRRIVCADGASVIDSRNSARLRGRDRSAVDELFLPVNNDLLAGLEVGAGGEHRASAYGEVDVDEDGVERLTRLSILAGRSVPTSLFFVFGLLVAGRRGRALGLSAAGGGVCGRLAREVLQLVGRRRTGVHDEDVVALIAVFDGRCGDDERVRTLAEDEADVDELVGEEPAVLIVEDGLELRGARGGIDLVVDGEQRAA